HITSVQVAKFSVPLQVLLNRVDTSTAPDIEWPTSPAE
ncbi:tail fiber assembly protein, partial [Shigella boydii]|nr:tail fiber assembly protein [Shigella boydii]EFW3341421.1 tail fiber assembly protein [Shigella boydii]EFW6993999.1 tail fiber assembly protein [Shigella boydii]EIZ6998635.1 tail fiber assembly protein [Shigella boydii]HCS1894946.1 tail fiber assembly protein [Shigella boydii]